MNDNSRAFFITLGLYGLVIALYFLAKLIPKTETDTAPGDVNWSQIAQYQFTDHDPVAAARAAAEAQAAQEAAERARAEAERQAREQAAREEAIRRQKAEEQRIAEEHERRRREEEEERERELERERERQAARERAQEEERRRRAREQAEAERQAREQAEAAARAAAAQAAEAAQGGAAQQGGGMAQQGGGGGGQSGARVASWESRLRASIERQKRYPRNAQRNRQEGVVTVAFTVSATGNISNIRVQESSGYNILDQAGVNAVERVGRTDPHPSGQQINTSVPIRFEIR